MVLEYIYACVLDIMSLLYRLKYAAKVKQNYLNVSKIFT